MNLKKFKNFLIKRKTYFILGIIIFILFVVSSAFLINTLKTKETADKTWQIEVNYSHSKKKFSLSKISLINGKYIPDQRAALYSPYNLKVFDNSGKEIFSEKVNLSQEILYDYFNSASASSSFTNDVKSVFFVPFGADSSKIIIYKGNTDILEINLPKKTSYGFTPKAYAQTASISCGPVTTVFINDNYTNTNQFKSDVSYLENLYNTTPPYNVSPSIFDFKEVDQAQNFGCATSGIKWCIENKISNIKTAGLASYPSAQKFIVLVNNPNALSVDGGLAGLVNGVGGDTIIYTNFIYPGPTGAKPFAAASHELEGHAVGYLWDRYVSSDPNYSSIPAGFPQSNCSTGPQGESFWPQAGSTGVYKGCANGSQYAPYPLTCRSQTPALISGGTNNTIMSAIGCSPNEFDPVEQAWIKNNILPYYKPCSGGPVQTISPSPVPTTSPSLTPSPTGSPTPVPVVHSINGNAFVDSNNNGQKDSNEQNFQGLTVTLSGPYSGSLVTDSSGNYSFSNVPEGQYTISANDSYYHISFGSHTFTVTANTLAFTINFPIPPSALNTPTAEPTLVSPSPTQSPAPFPTIQATEVTPTPAPIPSAASYTCVFDPSCQTGQSSIQICPLKCTPN